MVALQNSGSTLLYGAGICNNKHLPAIYKYEVKESNDGNMLAGKLVLSKAASTSSEGAEELYKGMHKNNHKRKLDVFTLP